MTPALKRRLQWLLSSSLAAATLGAVSGAREAREAKASLSRHEGAVELNAADLALHFGVIDHSRTLLENLTRKPATDTGGWHTRMGAELRLALLDDEGLPHSERSTHLARARAACKQTELRTCRDQDMRELLDAIALQLQR